MSPELLSTKLFTPRVRKNLVPALHLALVDRAPGRVVACAIRAGCAINLLRGGFCFTIRARTIAVDIGRATALEQIDNSAGQHPEKRQGAWDHAECAKTIS